MQLCDVAQASVKTLDIQLDAGAATIFRSTAGANRLPRQMVVVSRNRRPADASALALVSYPLAQGARGLRFTAHLGPRVTR